MIYLFSEAKSYGYLTLIQKFHIKIERKIATDVQKQFSIFHNLIFNMYICPNDPGEFSIQCTRHIQSLNSKFTHFDSRVGGFRVGSGAFEIAFVAEKRVCLKTSLDCVHSSPTCPQSLTKTEFKSIIAAPTWSKWKKDDLFKNAERNRGPFCTESLKNSDHLLAFLDISKG